MGFGLKQTGGETASSWMQSSPGERFMGIYNAVNKVNCRKYLFICETALLANLPEHSRHASDP